VQQGNSNSGSRIGAQAGAVCETVQERAGAIRNRFSNSPVGVATGTFVNQVSSSPVGVAAGNMMDSVGNAAGRVRERSPTAAQMRRAAGNLMIQVGDGVRDTAGRVRENSPTAAQMQEAAGELI
jgi:hypothetical protein